MFGTSFEICNYSIIKGSNTFGIGSILFPALVLVESLITIVPSAVLVNVLFTFYFSTFINVQSLHILYFRTIYIN